MVVVRYGPLFDLTAVAAQLLAGDYLDNDHVTCCRARRVRVASRPCMWFSIDGELVGEQPITFTAVPHTLRVIVGPDYLRPFQPDVTLRRYQTRALDEVAGSLHRVVHGISRHV